MMKLIIQVPCYNEAQTLEIALNHLPKHIDGIDEIEYLIINDGSRDDTVKSSLCDRFDLIVVQLQIFQLCKSRKIAFVDLL